MTGIDPGEAVENVIKGWIEKPEYQAIEVPERADLEASSTRQAQQAIIEAAHRAGGLPEVLSPKGHPIDVAGLAVGSREWTELQNYLIDHGLTQYVTDYGQSHSNAVAPVADKSDDEKSDDDE